MAKSFTNFLLKVIIVFFTIVSTNLYSGTRTWKGSVNTDWNTVSNWTGGLPASGDDVIIPTSPAGGRMPTSSSGTNTIKSLEIQAGATLTQIGGTFSVLNKANIYGIFTQSAGTFSGGDDINVYSSASVNISGMLTTNGNKILIDGGSFTQSGGTFSTKDMQLQNSGTYNQSGGEFQIDHDLKVPTGTSFNATGGTVRFTGSAGDGAVYTGNVQFNNLIVDPGADYKLDNGDLIKISGNYTNNNTSLKDEKGTLSFNGTSSQTFYSASQNAIAANIIVTNSVGVTLDSDLIAKTSFTTDGGRVIINDHEIFVNGKLYEGPTPVELISFNASVNNNSVELTWKTATEVNNYGFEIERSADSENWIKIGFVHGYGNSNSTKEYSFEDSKLSSNSYYYRLKQIDADGTFSYSNIVNVVVDYSPNSFTLSQNYPNPFNPSTKIRYSVPTVISNAERNLVTLKIYDVLGTEVATLVNEEQSSGFYEVEFYGSKLSSGVYIYKIKTANFSDTKKMILSK